MISALSSDSRIVHVVSCLPPDGTGGIQTHVLSIAAEQSQRHRVAIIAFSPRNFDRGFLVEHVGNVEIYRLRRPERRGDEFDVRWPELDHLVEDILGVLKPDIVHLHELAGLSTGLVCVSKRFSRVVVLTLHDYLSICPTATMDFNGRLCLSPGEKCFWCVHLDIWSRRRQLHYWRLTNHVLIAISRVFRKARVSRLLRSLTERKYNFFTVIRQSDGVIACSHAQSQVFADSGLDCHIRVISHGVNGGADLPRREGSHIPLRFGFIGHHPVKGLELLLQVFAEGDFSAELFAFADLFRYPPGVRRRIRKLAQKTNVRLLGAFSSEQIDSVYGEIDVLIAPSLWVEPFGLVAAEAVARGVPVIAADTCGFEEIVKHEVNGLLFRRGDKDSLKAAISRCLNEPELVARLRANCKVTRTVCEEALEIENFYNELLQGATFTEASRCRE
ncbi:MAG: glycosyltransferase [Armatimonadota bacterium]